MSSTPHDTIFGKIIRHEADAKIIFQDDDVTAFADAQPVAPAHVLIVPNKSLRTLNDATEEDERLLGKMLLTAQRVAQQLDIAASGYRLVLNCNRDGGQSVSHLHIHLLGGRKLTWPPG